MTKRPKRTNLLERERLKAFNANLARPAWRRHGVVFTTIQKKLIKFIAKTDPYKNGQIYFKNGGCYVPLPSDGTARGITTNHLR